MKNIRIILMASYCLIASACSREISEQEWTCDEVQEIDIRISCLECESKAAYPQEDKIYNANLYIYDANGLLETHVYHDFSSGGAGSSASIKIRTMIGRRCNIYVVANTGYQLQDFSLADIRKFRWNMAYPDDYARGIIMAGKMEDTVIDANSLKIQLERVMAKLSVRMDRSMLEEGVEMSIREIRVGNCARNAILFDSSAVEKYGDVFNIGFMHDGSQARKLNISDSHGLSPELSLYMLENIAPPDVIGGQSVPNRDLASYVEIRMDYLSDYYYTDSGKSLVYRFYIRDGEDAVVRRNCHYHVTVRPHSDGLSCDDSWRVDKSGLSQYEGKPYLKIIPSGTTIDGIFYPNYYTLDKDGSMHFRVNRYPPSMEISLREDLVEDERSEGRAIYIMDSDNMGFTLKAMGRRCVSMMEIIPSDPLTYMDAETIITEIE